MLHRFFVPVLRPVSYRYGLPFILSVVLALLTAALPRFGGPTSIWTFALLALIATSFTLLFGGRFRTFYIVIAVMPPFLFSSSGSFVCVRSCRISPSNQSQNFSSIS